MAKRTIEVDVPDPVSPASDALGNTPDHAEYAPDLRSLDVRVARLEGGSSWERVRRACLTPDDRKLLDNPDAAKKLSATMRQEFEERIAQYGFGAAAAPAAPEEPPKP